MKALLIKYHGPTNTKESRLSVQSEGLEPTFVTLVQDVEVDDQVWILASAYFTNRLALNMNEQKYAIGQLPNGDYTAVLI